MKIKIIVTKPKIKMEKCFPPKIKFSKFDHFFPPPKTQRSLWQNTPFSFLFYFNFFAFYFWKKTKTDIKRQTNKQTNKSIFGDLEYVVGLLWACYVLFWWAIDYGSFFLAFPN
jgi:hypothetical protein